MNTITTQQLSPAILQAQAIYKALLNIYYKEEQPDFTQAAQLLKNPFNGNKESLMLEVRDGKLQHRDLEREGQQGDAFEFAQLHFGSANMLELAPLLWALLHQDANTGDNAVSAVCPASGTTNPTAYRDASGPAAETSEAMETAAETYPPCWPLSRVWIPKFSGFRAPISNTKPCEILTLEQVYQRIRSPKYAAITQQLRGIEDKKQRRKFKAKAFDYVTFGGIFSQRKDAALELSSNLMVFDFDELGDNVANVWNQLCNDEALHTRLLFVSPSGNGLKWVVSYDPAVSSYGQFFTAVSHYLQQRYNLLPDKSGRDASRACFICYDPEVYYGE